MKVKIYSVERLNKVKEYLVYLSTLAIILVLAYFLFVMVYLIGNFDALVQNNLTLFESLISASFILAGFCMTIGVFALNQSFKKLKDLHKEYFGYAILFILGGFLMFSNLISGEYAQLMKGQVILWIYLLLLILGMIGIGLFTVSIGALIFSLWRTYNYNLK